MGTSCVTSNNNQKKQYKKTQNFQLPPENLEDYNPKNNPTIQILTFDGSLQNIKIQGIANMELGIRFQIINQQINAYFPPKSPSGNQFDVIKWRLKNQTFKIRANQYEIRKDYLDIKILNKDDSIYDQLKVNLYKILTGPIRNNFKLKSDIKQNIHLIFDLKISQSIQVDLICRNANFFIKNEFPGEKFNFTLQLMLFQNGQNSKRISTKPSYQKETPLQKQIIYSDFQLSEQQNIQKFSPIKRVRSKMTTLTAKISQFQKLEWDLIENRDMPTIHFKTSSSEITSSILIFHVWRIGGGGVQQNSKILMHRFANFKFTLQQLLDKNSDQYLKSCDSGPKQIVSIIQHEVWSNGIIIGSCNCQFKVKLPKFIRQMSGWTRTQIQNVNLMIQSFGSDRQVVYLSFLQKMNSFYLMILKINAQILVHNNYFAKRQIYRRANEILEEIANNLVQTYNESFIHYSLQQFDELYEKQKFFLKMAQSIIHFIEDEECDFIEICWKIIIFLIKRGQFMLVNIGFSDFQKQQILQKFNLKDFLADICRHKNLQILHLKLRKKIKMAIQYQSILFQCLRVSLSSIPMSGQSGYSKKEYCEMFKAYCYFRVPIFRTFFLQKIYKNGDFQYDEFQINQKEWLKTKYEIKEKQNRIITQIDWSHHFYKIIQFHNQSNEENQQLKKVLQNCYWIEQIEKRRSIYFQFLRLIFVKLDSIQQRIKVPNYQYFSGYNRLVASLLNEMRQLSLKDYTIHLIVSSAQILKNDELIQTVIKIIAQKTNLYETTLVIKTLNIFKYYVNFLTQNSKTLSRVFCYGTFIKVIKLILDSQSSYCVSSAILLLYEVYQKLDPQFQLVVSIYFLGKKFSNLFYHWSYAVRNIFYHFFVLKISQNKKIFIEQHSKPYIKYKEAVQLIQSMLKKSKQTIISSNTVNFDKSLYIKMKHKLWQKKNKQKNKQNDQNQETYKQLMQLNHFAFRKSHMNNVAVHNLQTENDSIKIFNYQEIVEHEQFIHKSDSVMIKSRTMFQEPDSPIKIPMLMLSKKYTFHETVKYNGSFIEAQFQLSQLTARQMRRIQSATKQFILLNEQIRNDYIANHTLPEIHLNNELGLDGKEMRPDDFQIFRM